ncbi:hypothetical protein SNEBB_011477 [Seison nebaliae]|nr:hypothetical protein SNEBB_011477 [Seison nebaliae]
MLVKIETKSARVKGLAFHNKRPWLLVSLHNGIIQLWDFRMNALIDTFDEHDGPVRGIDFHHQQPLFVSGGDDYKIKIWNYKLRRCTFTLLGHLDYIRTTFFHHEYPWVLSASDDQTIRIWNWQSRTSVSVLTGHNHYVMCAQFHPSEDLVVSASLDQTIRIWDISTLRIKNVAPSASPDNISAHLVRQTGTPDLFGQSDAIVRHILEGHERGVNWCSFHPSLPLVISAADDRTVKLWRYNESKAWEVDSCRGHYGNVSCVLFHPRQELIISNSEDRSIRVWDMSKRTSLHIFRRDSDRFWVLTAHPTLNLFAAGHDNGCVVFKLERERPAYIVHTNKMFYVKDRYIRCLNFDTDKDTAIILMRNHAATSAASTNPAITQSGKNMPYSLSYNPAENSILVNIRPSSCDLYPLTNKSGQTTIPSEPTEPMRSNGLTAIWVARNRFAILGRPYADRTITILIKNLSNEIVKKLQLSDIDEIYAGGTGFLLLRDGDNIRLFDIHHKRCVSQIRAPKTRYISWNQDGSYVALMAKNIVTICNRRLESVCSVNETTRIKSGIWDPCNVFIYTTANHIKYTLLSGDHGIIRTLDMIVYATKIVDQSIYCLDRQVRARVLNVDTTEYRFKNAIVNQNHDEVMHMVRNANLVGQGIIAFMQQKDYSELALQFVKDLKTRFALALECSRIDVALECAKEIDERQCWDQLAREALWAGEHETVEFVYKRNKNFDKLNFFYLITGNIEKLEKMLKIAEMRSDFNLHYFNSLCLGRVEERVKLLESCGEMSLAYLTSATHGLEERCGEISKQLTVIPKIDDHALLFVPPLPITPLTDDISWPQLHISHMPLRTSHTDAAGRTIHHTSDLDGEIKDEDLIGKWDDANLDLDSVTKDGEGVGDEMVDEGGWDDELDITADLEIAESELLVSETHKQEVLHAYPASSIAKQWSYLSSRILHHVMAGDFQSSFKLLKNQFGVVKFEEYKDIFLMTFASAKCGFSPLSNLPPVVVHPVKRQRCSTGKSTLLPFDTIKIDSLIRWLQNGYHLFTVARLKEAGDIFRKILLYTPLLPLESRNDLNEIEKLTEICKNYILATKMESLRRELNKSKDDESNKVRATELALYLSNLPLEQCHRLIFYRTALGNTFKLRNFKLALNLGSRLIEMGPKAETVEQTRKIIRCCEANPVDVVELNYDLYNPFEVCCASFTPIYRGRPVVRCPLSSAAYHPKYKGELCQISNVTEIGQECCGLQLPSHH